MRESGTNQHRREQPATSLAPSGQLPQATPGRHPKAAPGSSAAHLPRRSVARCSRCQAAFDEGRQPIIDTGRRRPQRARVVLHDAAPQLAHGGGLVRGAGRWPTRRAGHRGNRCPLRSWRRHPARAPGARYAGVPIQRAELGPWRRTAGEVGCVKAQDGAEGRRGLQRGLRRVHEPWPDRSQQLDLALVSQDGIGWLDVPDAAHRSDELRQAHSTDPERFQQLVPGQRLRQLGQAPPADILRDQVGTPVCLADPGRCPPRWDGSAGRPPAPR